MSRIASHLPFPALLTPSHQPASSHPVCPPKGEKLYPQETIYTLRLLPEHINRLISNKQGDDVVDIGPTVRPVMVKKRSGLPDWRDMEGALGREVVVGSRSEGLWR